MPLARSKAEIQQQISNDHTYQEDINFILSTISKGEVFIGQLYSGQYGQSLVSFCVTVGMYMYDLPEVIMCGVPVPLVKSIISELCELHDFDREFLGGQRTKIISGLKTVAMKIDKPSNFDVLNICHDVYTLNGKEGLEAVQVVFANERGKFPWASSYGVSERQHQPILGFSDSGIMN